MPSPYTLDLFQALHVNGDIDLHALFMEMTAPDLPWGSVALPQYASLLRGSWCNVGGGRVHCNPGVLGALTATKPDVVVVSGYSSLTTQLVMRWLKWRRMPWIFWGELPGMRKLGAVRHRMRSFARYPAIAWPSAIAAIGRVAQREYRTLAYPGCVVKNLPYYTDLEPFLTQPRSTSPDEVRVLYCGQLIERKGVLSLLDSFLALAYEIPRLTLQLVGDGPLREQLERKVPAALKPRVQFTGFQPVHALPKYFSSADIFVLPSRHDGWGVVVNQALGAGLPLICSDQVGAAHDLITEGSNGDIVPVDNTELLIQSLRQLALNPDKCQEYGAKSRAIALKWTPACGAERWVRLINSVVIKTK